MSIQDFYIMSGARTPIGDFAGALKDFLGHQLAVPPMEAATEMSAEKYKIAREEMEEAAYRSHKSASKAMAEGKFKQEILPVPIPQRKGAPKIFDTDEHPCKDIFAENLSKLPMVFKKGERSRRATPRASTTGLLRSF